MFRIEGKIRIICELRIDGDIIRRFAGNAVDPDLQVPDLRDPSRQRFEIRGVMGPDEYHDAYPEAAEPGLNNNAYTNLMAVWVLCWSPPTWRI